MSFSNKFSLNFACFSNENCRSGFCWYGRCREPESVHDYCDPTQRNCPKPLKCSEYSRTCVPSKFQRQFTCRNVSDCRYGDFCINGKCKASIPIGSSCDSVIPDLCKLGSKCTSISQKFPTKCYELCDEKVPCPSGYKCTENLWNADPICIPQSRSRKNPLNNDVFVFDEEIVTAMFIVLAFLVILLGLVYAWIRFTRSVKKKELGGSKKKRKKLRLSYAGNGLATVTLIPSNCQSPNPVAASQLFTNSQPVGHIELGPPPAYSEIINIQ